MIARRARAPKFIVIRRTPRSLMVRASAPFAAGYMTTLPASEREVDRPVDQLPHLRMRRGPAVVLAAEDEGHVPRPDEAPIEPVDLEDLRQGRDGLRLLDQPETEHLAIGLLQVLGRRLRESVARGPARAGRAANAARRIPGGPDQSLGVRGAVAVGQDQPLHPRVEIAENERGLPVRHSGEGRRAAGLGSARQVAHPLGIDAGMLAVGDHEVEACHRAELEELRRPELLEQRADARLPGGDLLAESVRSRHRRAPSAPGAREARAPCSAPGAAPGGPSR